MVAFQRVPTWSNWYLLCRQGNYNMHINWSTMHQAAYEIAPWTQADIHCPEQLTFTWSGRVWRRRQVRGGLQQQTWVLQVGTALDNSGAVAVLKSSSSFLPQVWLPWGLPASHVLQPGGLLQDPGEKGVCVLQDSPQKWPSWSRRRRSKSSTFNRILLWSILDGEKKVENRNKRVSSSENCHVKTNTSTWNTVDWPVKLVCSVWIQTSVPPLPHPAVPHLVPIL